MWCRHQTAEGQSLKSSKFIFVTLLIGLSTTLLGCRKSSDCDPETFAESCLPDGKVRTCDRVRHWLPEPYVTSHIKEYTCQDDQECVGSKDQKDAGCVPVQPDACPAGFRGRACIDGTAIQCDPDATNGRWLIARCYSDYVCNTEFVNYPACVSPYMSVSESDPEFEAWLESHKASAAGEANSGTTSD